jgi:hypothetical protein
MNQQIQCTVAQKNGQARRSTGFNSMDAQKYGLVVKNRRLSFLNMRLAGAATSPQEFFTGNMLSSLSTDKIRSIGPGTAWGPQKKNG